ncbi:uncharacterized protein LOC110007203 [Amborella trichopoda]|uniref:uncharacterized protein LOC110007203 n=1 Tax=Amborella trichopoda TaxID=13333 RepID=UPI0009BEE441|nr:uncharacterized protein LOC110007203 [Amborella trichopoda]|eukprot:XP_020522551.1 uncharacterized protein LOC110007203 [Amborella trichopoda]
MVKGPPNQALVAETEHQKIARAFVYQYVGNDPVSLTVMPLSSWRCSSGAGHRLCFEGFFFPFSFFLCKSFLTAGDGNSYFRSSGRKDSTKNPRGEVIEDEMPAFSDPIPSAAAFLPPSITGEECDCRYFGQ